MTEEEKQEQKTLSVEALLKIAQIIEKHLNEKYHLSSAEIMFIGTTLQAAATADYMIHKLIKNAQVIEISPEKIIFDPGNPGRN